jgi:hypothetical protein
MSKGEAGREGKNRGAEEAREENARVTLDLIETASILYKHIQI